MRQCGTLVYDTRVQDWKIRIGSEVFETYNGLSIEIWIKDRYYEALFEKDYNECVVMLEDDITFSLRLVEEYNIRISEYELISELDLPF